MRIVIMFFVIAIAAAAAPAALSATLDEAGEQTTIDNETWTPSAGSVTTLEQSNLANTDYDDDVVVTGENGNRVYEGDDYVWIEGNGTIKTVTGGELDGDASAEISYGYQQTTAQQRGFASMFSQIPNVMGLALPLFALLTVVIFFRGA